MNENKKIDWIITFVPFILIISIATLFFIFPIKSNDILSRIRFFFGDTLGIYYLVLGIGIFIISLYLSFSKIGDIKLGNKDEKPQYPFLVWGSMMFTCGLAADILFYSFAEWIMYSDNPHVTALGPIDEWANVYTLFHWSFIPWAFYLVLAVAFGFMLHVKKSTKQRYSEACRPIINTQSDGFIGRIIDLFAIFALLAGTATTFSVATPLMSTIIIKLLGIHVSRNFISIIILVITCIVYTYAVLHGLKGISLLAKVCMFSFFGLLAYVFFLGGQWKFIIENGFESFGRMVQNFISLSTYIDPKRENSFPQDWTIYYWAYWMVWCIAAPFFIGNISRGRTIRQTILGGYCFGVGSTIISFIVLGNYSLGLQVQGKSDFIGIYAENGDLYQSILDIINTLPGSSFVLILVLFTMMAFYATSFDSIAYTAASYSYKNLGENDSPNKLLQLLWCILLIVLPIALVFSDSSMANIQSVSIISAFPIGIIMLIMISGFIKDVNKNI
ncbi:BCCT family transporter [Pseudobutyrivibrio xylanivorans]|uniref:Betaine/carnitine transporter, BCCT family n=1 Tax=Pseudobutyrivibrio xylanivorans TaxID=185007 RepID=A0A1G5S6K9_PSEXY|nr:BCCT family transporter [Pseudobutyrivibrio xylanivorans]SCZ81199.1 betaine/carnitine transporter, BCCT family [Pseudobutyrivibrio xylanivorans]